MWEQVKSFNVKKMGKRKGYCLQNVRLGFGIGSKYASAKVDMEANKKAGTLHPISTIPTNVSVPVYVDTSSKYEHIIVCDKGTYYSDGRKLKTTKGLKFFGWGELCEGVRVVKEVADKKTKYTAGSYEVTTDTLNVRSGAGTQFRLVTQIHKGSKQGVDRVSKNWGHLMNNAGWICLDYCKKI